MRTKKDRRQRIKLRIRKKMRGTADRPRLVVFRSVAHMSAQVVDDLVGRTVAAASSIEPEVRGKLTEGARPSNVAGARLIGRVVAERSLQQGIARVVFDRNGFLYHGRVRAVAEAAREAGLEF
ncbi:MAG: 50S ribosomal protein L18 [Luteitalea sp.]|nr:50S ribosomal protein L18 [Luteitalea sp.]